MGRLFHLGTIAGIPLKLHWTFGLMILFVGYVASLHDLSLAATVGFALLVLSMFVCVIMHEFGHALSAKSYGISTHDIIISPIGGLARLSDIPEKPLQELVIAFAGPLVNVVIAGISAVALLYVMDTSLLPSSDDFELLARPSEFLKFVFIMNLGLFAFNLIPAFPMDGGRVLRALLTLVIDRVLATRIAMWIGRILAIGFLIMGYYGGNITWGFIGIFVFIMAGKEYQHVLFTKKSKSPVRDIMRPLFTKFQISDTLEYVVNTIQNSNEKNFLVFKEEKLVGSLPEILIKVALKSHQSTDTLDLLITPNVAIVSPNTALSNVANMMNENAIAICAVLENDRIIAAIDRYDISNFFNKK